MESQQKVDAITYEVIKNKLTSIITDQTATIRQVSGSPIVSEATDFSSGIYLPDGLPLKVGLQFPGHANSLFQMIQSTIKDCSENPGIFEKDQFFCNHPWKGALHQSDVGVVAPIIYKGEIVAWSGALAHQIDVGGSQFGSWVSRAIDIYMEAVPLPPVKFIEKGKLRKDIWEVILAHTRLPFLLGLDLRALVAANNVARTRFIELVERYGIEIVNAVMNGLIEETEEGLRNRLRELPDGTYRGAAFWEHDGHENRLYKTMSTAIKKEDNLTLDFTGTSPQAPGFINATEPASIGAVAGQTLISLCFDIPWTGGVFKVIKVVIPKGTVASAEFPAPVSSATCGSMFMTGAATYVALSKMLSCSGKYFRDEVHSVNGHSTPVFNLGGINQYGDPFGTMLLDAGLCGGGANASVDGKDGVGCAGELPTWMVADVETNENFAPIFYLFRRLVPNSGGGGKFRGGLGVELAITPHETEKMVAGIVSHGVEAPHQGIWGGGPGGCGSNVLIKGSDFWERLKKDAITPSIENLKGEKKDLGAKPVNFFPFPSDIVWIINIGTGGYGDPLDRDVNLVREDVVNRLLSIERAQKIYGVVLDPVTLELDIEGTSNERKRILEARRTSCTIPPMAPQLDSKGASGLMPMGEYLEVIKMGEQKTIRCRCGYQLCSIKDNWKDFAAIANLPPEEEGEHVKLHEDLELKAYFCPSCWVRLSVEIKRKDEPPLWDIELDI